MRTVGPEPVGPVLRTIGRRRREPGVDATAGRAVHASAILREPENGGMARNAGIRGEPETGVAADDGDGNRGRLSEAEAEPAGRRAQDLSVPGGCDGLVQPVRPELEVVGDPGTRLLCRGAEVRLATGPPGDFQYRSGFAVHQ